MSRRPEKKHMSKAVATSGVKVQRYFPGKAPEDRVDLSASESEDDDRAAGVSELIRVTSLGSAEPAQRAVRVRKDARTSVLASESGSGSGSGSDDEDTERLMRARLAARQRANAQGSSSEGESEDSDTHRASMRAAMLKHSRQARIESESSDEQSAATGESSEGSGESGSESESEESDPGYAPPPMLKPVFVPKSQRQAPAKAAQTPGDMHTTHASLESDVQEQLRLERRKESVRQAAEEARRAREQPPELENDTLESVDDTDGRDAPAEYAAWKLRELLRIKRDKERNEEIDLAEEERERRQAMSEEARYREDVEHARLQREEKAQRIREEREERGDEPGAARSGADEPGADDHVSRTMLMYARERAEGKRKTKWKGLRGEDTSTAGGGPMWRK
ncbi:hypothetical protein GGI07_003443 [Coemansia sp. Benny D115]|nr:hypothetical protein GGI07_003443 [Coemansia sp. Benny D115]